MAVFLACSLGPSAFAQFRASLSGTVTDPEGAVVQGAEITLTDTDTGKMLKTVTSDWGSLHLPGASAEPLHAVVVVVRIKSSTIRNLTLIPEQSNNVDIRLELGEANITVAVNADAVPQIETANANTTGTIDSNEIQHLPSSGRDIFTLVQLAPGVFGDQARQGGGGTQNLPGTQGPGGNGSGIFGTENGAQASANGGQYETNGVAIDGISTVSAVWGGTSVITPNEDSVGNVKVLSNGYDAENGRFSGAQIQLTSKSGTNDYHGSFFFRFNRPGLDAYQRTTAPARSIGGVLRPADSSATTPSRISTVEA